MVHLTESNISRIHILHADGGGALQRTPTEQFGKFRTSYGRFANHPNIICNDHELDRIREYIVNNPLQWTRDRENPDIVRATGRSPQLKDAPWRI